MLKKQQQLLSRLGGPRHRLLITTYLYELHVFLIIERLDEVLDRCRTDMFLSHSTFSATMGTHSRGGSAYR